MDEYVSASELSEIVNLDQRQIPTSTTLGEASSTSAQSDTNPPNVNLTENNFLKCIGQNPFGHFEKADFQAPLENASENQQIDWVTPAEIDAYSPEQLVDRLAQLDADLLSSLRWKGVQVCPECFSRSLAERKTETLEGKHYCSACRKRVKAAYVPYYLDMYTANPFKAVTQHRYYLKTRLDESIAQLKLIEMTNLINDTEQDFPSNSHSLLIKSYHKDIQAIAERFSDSNSER